MLDILDETGADDTDEKTESQSSSITSATASIIHTRLGSPKPETTLKGFMEVSTGLGNPLPRTFQGNLETFLNNFCTMTQPLTHTRYMRLHKDDKVMIFISIDGGLLTWAWQVVEFRYIRVNYESVVDWKIKTDILRCNESFHGRQRYDHVLVIKEDGYFFARILRLFQIVMGTQSHPVAYIKSYCRPSGRVGRKDRDLGLHRVRVKAHPYEIISVQSIVRGALLVQDSDNPDDYFVVDTIDGDMFLRMQSLVF